MSKHHQLSRRESEVMEILFRTSSATARFVWDALGKNRTYSTIRKILSILEEKGHVKHRTVGSAFVYSPRIPREKAASSALSRLVETFFEGSVEGAVSGLLGLRGKNLSSDELGRIGQMIEEAREKESESESESKGVQS